MLVKETGPQAAAPRTSMTAGGGPCDEASQGRALRSVVLREEGPGFSPTRVCGRLAVVAWRTGVSRRGRRSVRAVSENGGCREQGRCRGGGGVRAADEDAETGGLVDCGGARSGGWGFAGAWFPSPCGQSLQKSHCHDPASLGASGSTPMSQHGPWALAPSSADHVVARSRIGFVMGRAATIRTRSAPCSTRRRTPRTAM